jgi:hypothetical protein
MRVLVFVGLFIFCAFSIKAQNSAMLPAYKDIVQLKPSYGFNFPLTKLLNNSTVDDLLEYSDNSDYLQIYGVTFFSKKHWGVELNYQAVNTHMPDNNYNRFKQKMEAAYDANFYVNTSSSAEYGSIFPLIGQVNKGYIGLVYRYERGRFFYYPKVNLGITSFQANWGKVKLKEKNTNRYDEIMFEPNKRPVDMLFFGVSQSAGLKLNKYIYLNFDSMLGFTYTNLSYTKTQTQLASKQSTIENISYKNYLATLSAGLGLIVVLY